MDSTSTGRRSHAARLVAEDLISDWQIAHELGISQRTLERWKKQPAFQDDVGNHLVAVRARLAQPHSQSPSRRRPKVADRERQSRLAANLRKYGLTVAAYRQMQKEQGDVCAICAQSFTIVRCVVDHDHIDGRVRGLLCIACNTGLGMLQDSPAMLQAALQYLEN